MQLMAGDITHDPSRLKISPSIANITETFKSSRKHAGTASLLIHIQDAHTNLGAPEYLSDVLEELGRKYKLRTVIIGGGAEDDSFTY